MWKTTLRHGRRAPSQSTRIRSVAHEVWTALGHIRVDMGYPSRHPVKERDAGFDKLNHRSLSLTPSASSAYPERTVGK
jgi:hypothetical protein